MEKQRVFHNVSELLKRLNTERRLISEMFYNRKKLEFHYDDARGFVESEKNLNLLIQYGVIRQEGELLELEEVYLRFLEEILQVNEDISNASVEESVSQLRDNIDYYLKEQNNPEGQHRYLRKVKRSLRTIALMAERNVVDLKRNVNGCFWHGHNVALPQMSDIRCKMDDVIVNSECCKIPNTNREFWVAKIRRNKERDKEEQCKLAEMGWHCITVWECELKPSKREETLDSIAFTLNQIWLQDHQVRIDGNMEPRINGVPYPQFDEEDIKMPMAAEDVITEP